MKMKKHNMDERLMVGQAELTPRCKLVQLVMAMASGFKLVMAMASWFNW
jgi:hypothetical protein